MTMQLIKIEPAAIGGMAVQSVNARDLHMFLEARKDFSNWIKDRIFAYDFEENQDYVVFANFGDNPTGGRPSKEYALTLDMAKELAMVERNEKGKQARRYFIECERRAKEPTGVMGGLLMDKVVSLEAIISRMQPQIEALTRLHQSSPSVVRSTVHRPAFDPYLAEIRHKIMDILAYPDGFDKIVSLLKRAKEPGLPVRSMRRGKLWDNIKNYCGRNSIEFNNCLKELNNNDVIDQIRFGKMNVIVLSKRFSK